MPLTKRPDREPESCTYGRSTRRRCIGIGKIPAEFVELIREFEAGMAGRPVRLNVS